MGSTTMPTTSEQYTFNDDLFKESLAAGLRGAGDSVDVDVFLVGGGAVQWYAHNPSLRRATVDVDLQSQTYLRKAQRNVWGTHTISHLQEAGLDGVYRASRSGGEVSLMLPGEGTPFFVNLDMYTNAFHAANQAAIDAECERTRPLQLTPGGPTYAVEAPEDIISHKLRRLVRAEEEGRLEEDDARNVRLLTKGLVDDVETGDLHERLAAASRTRGMSLEQVAREGYDRRDKIIRGYKDEKNVFDTLLLVEAHRANGIIDDPRIIAENMRRYAL